MLAFLAAPGNLPFSVALGIMFALALLEGVGLLLGAGLSSLIDSLLPDIDLDVDAPDVDSPGAVSSLLGWLHVGKVPMLVVLIAWLTSFGIAGLALQSLVLGLSGGMLGAWLAAPVAFALALPLTRWSAALAQRFMPGDETEAVSSGSFVGRVAVITTGIARIGSPAQARLSDEYGQTHYVMVEPDRGQPDLASGSEALLVDRRGHVFIAIANPSSHLTDS